MYVDNMRMNVVESGTFVKGDSLIFGCKKLEDDIKELGKKILQHEENIRYLKNVRKDTNLMIAEMQVTLGNHDLSRPYRTEVEVHSYNEKLEETIMINHKNSAAAIWLKLRDHCINAGSQVSSSKDGVIGVVATLGKFDDINLSRILSEYLGLDMMLALVCKTFPGVQALESYDEKGNVNKNTSLHALGASIWRKLSERFNVICLEHLRPYVGEFLANDPQRRLALLEPKLPNGEPPKGFLGFAVNMVMIDNKYVNYFTMEGHGLRETLFYTLFSKLQVYATTRDMMQAIPFLAHGAIALDGGIIRVTGIISHFTPDHIDVHFPMCLNWAPYLSEEYLELRNKIKELTWKVERINEDIKREESLLAFAKSGLGCKKELLIKSMVQTSLQVNQRATQGRSAPN